MHATLLLFGLSHRSASVETRERFWFNDDRASRAMEFLADAPGVQEMVLLSTCNRTEFVFWASDAAEAADSLRAFLRRESGLTDDDWARFYHFGAEAACAHLFRVTTGLDSMVVGEPQIAGQVKSAWHRAQRAQVCGRMLDAVFQKALNVSKRARTETAIGSAAVSAPYAAVELARQIFGSLAGRRVVLLGAGKMSELSARYLAASGARHIDVINRTYVNAQALAGALGGRAVPYEARWDSFAQADIVISSTGCPHVILTREDAERIHLARRGRPIFLIDIAVPRDIDPAVRELPGTYLYDIDDLQRVVAQNLAGRQKAAAAAGAIVEREAGAFFARLDAERVVPTIIALRDALELIRMEELEASREALEGLNPVQMRALEQMTARMTQRLANRLARELKQAPGISERDALAEAVRKLFRLDAPKAVSLRTQ